MITRAMIFSAGLGTRFKPWTDKHPKALAIVNGKSLLQRNIEYLQQYGIRSVIVNVHHFAEQIIDAVKQNNGWGSEIIFSDERGELLDTGGGLLKAENLFIPGDALITCNVDILTDLNIDKLVAFHKANQPIISFGVTDRKSSRVLLFNDESKLCGWRNKQTGEEKISIANISTEDSKQPPFSTTELNEKAYSCVAIFEPSIFNLMREAGFSGKFSLTDVYLKLASNYTIMGYDHSGDRLVDVGKPESVAVAEALFPNS
jgi:NDP-sugar pyrophosphorylase family protein